MRYYPAQTDDQRRWQIRADGGDTDAVKEAAKRSRLTFSEFVRRAALKEAMRDQEAHQREETA